MKKSFTVVGYYLSAFIAGMSVMAIEMNSTRLLAPYFGDSLYVWTNVIGIVLVALAGGYYVGGRLADRYAKPSLYFALFFLTGLWTVLIPFFALPIFQLIAYGFSNLADVVLYGSFVAVLLFFSVPLFFLGMIVPFTVKLVVQDVEHLGSLSGSISMVSTVGSLVGTFLPAFFLIPTFGTTKTFIFIGVILMLTPAFGLRKGVWALVGLASVGLLWVVPPVYSNENLIYSVESPYGLIFVTEDEEGVRRLHVNNVLGTQSIYDPNSVIPPERYYYSYFGILPALVEDPKEVLILGHAGGTFTRVFNTYFPELEVTGVELDPAMTEVATAYMGLDEAQVDLVHGDARAYLLTTEKTYDLILVDTYQSVNIPPHLATQDFFNLAASHLNEGGVMALNAAAAESELLDVLQNSVAMHFSSAARLQIPNSYNSMILAGQGPFEFHSTVPMALSPKAEYFQEHMNPIVYDADAEVFTDEKATRVELLTNAMEMEIFKKF